MSTSPGPCAPSQAGISIAALRLAGEPDTALPALGVCLGRQALAEAYGGRVTRATAPMHGKSSLVWHDGSPPFVGVPSPTEVMRYHSLIMDAADLPDPLRVTARTSDGEIMGLTHRTLAESMVCSSIQSPLPRVMGRPCLLPFSPW